MVGKIRFLGGPYWPAQPGGPILGGRGQIGQHRRVGQLPRGGGQLGEGKQSLKRLNGWECQKHRFALSSQRHLLFDVGTTKLHSNPPKSNTLKVVSNAGPSPGDRLGWPGPPSAATEPFLNRWQSWVLPPSNSQSDEKVDQIPFICGVEMDEAQKNGNCQMTKFHPQRNALCILSHQGILSRNQWMKIKAPNQGLKNQ
jgi:hypothetical protein